MPIIATNSQPTGTLLGVTDSTTQCCSTPTAPYDASVVSCNGQNILSAPVSTVNGTPLLNKLKTVSIKAGHKTKIRWQLHDQSGNPVNISECVDYCSSMSASEAEPTTTITFKAREYLLINQVREPVFTREATIIDAESGIIEVELTANDTQHPGIYFAEMTVDIDCDDDIPGVYFSNIFYLSITTSLSFSNNSYTSGPPTMAEIRLHLRDTSTEESFLMDNVLFDDSEIALAIIRPIQQFNETPPELSRKYTTSDFPYRYFWLEGICANLYFMVSEFFRKNNLTYSAAGIQVNDMDKTDPYMQVAELKRKIWTDFVRNKKVEMNLSGCFGTLSSPYSHI